MSGLLTATLHAILKKESLTTQEKLKAPWQVQTLSLLDMLHSKTKAFIQQSVSKQ